MYIFEIQGEISWFSFGFAHVLLDTDDSETVDESSIDTNSEDTGTEETSTEDTQVEDIAEEYQDPWPDDEASMGNMLSIVSEGEIISEHDTLRSVSAQNPNQKETFLHVALLVKYIPRLIAPSTSPMPVSMQFPSQDG